MGGIFAIIAWSAAALAAGVVLGLYGTAAIVAVIEELAATRKAGGRAASSSRHTQTNDIAHRNGSVTR